MPVFKTKQTLGYWPGFPAIADFNEDGHYEPFGYLNNGDGTFTDVTGSILSLLSAYPNRVHRDNRAIDIDGDGHLDIIWNVYADPSHPNNFTVILKGDGLGGFTLQEERRDIRGFGETIVAADFNNDGWTDVYVPVYTHVEGSDSSYLLLNEGGTLGSNSAAEWGVSLSYLAGVYRVEGAQAADINFDGKIDMFVGSHLFVNEGSSFSAITLNPFFFEEGASLFDYDNDGDFDLVVRPADPYLCCGSCGSGEVCLQTSPVLFEFEDGQFTNKGYIGGSDFVGGYGLKVADIDMNGWLDVVFGSVAGLTVLFNRGGTFERQDVDPTLPITDSLAIGDLNSDGRPDVVIRSRDLYYYENDTLETADIHLNVLGVLGELNQHGRSILFQSLSDPSAHFARVVESGSGYMGQDQYTLQIGLPADGAYSLTIPLATMDLVFTASENTVIDAYANGTVSIRATDGGATFGGSDGKDSLIGDSGSDTVIASGGADYVEGGEGVDTIDFSQLEGGIFLDLGSRHARIASTEQVIAGFEIGIGTRSDDTFVSYVGTLQLKGLDGDDLYLIETAVDLVEEHQGGYDEVRTGLELYELPDGIERLTGTSAASQSLIGNDLDNHISAAVGGNRFEGKLGNDVYETRAGDIVIEQAGEGVDEVRTSVLTYILGDHVEILNGTEIAGQVLAGNTGANTISGGGGGDVLAGGGGDDLYIVVDGDLVVEEEDGGYDEVHTALSTYTLAANAERLIGTAAAGQALFGNDRDNFLSGASGSGGDLLGGAGGNDTYFVGANDIVQEAAGEGLDEVITALGVYQLSGNVENLRGVGAGAQRLSGNDLDNMIYAPEGYTFVQGGSLLIGGNGNDTYVIVNAQDRVLEAAGGGTDTISTSVSYNLAITNAASFTNVERLVATDPSSTTNINLAGDGAANELVGNAGDNFLDGSVGDDNLFGLDGRDVLFGGAGADTMAGGRGDDEMHVDNSMDRVVELEGEGIDAVRASVSFALSADAHVEMLTTTGGYGTTPINLTGNAYNQTIFGNYGANILNGGGGADVLLGFGGDDEYRVDDVRDVVIEAAGEGRDVVRASGSYALSAGSHIEMLTTSSSGATVAINLTGNELKQTIMGNNGSNVLNGGGGADSLIGYNGDDEYIVTDRGDVVVEGVGGGTDTVRSAVSYALTADSHVEFLTLLDAEATTPLNLAGNALNQTLIGNRGNNILDGAGGADILLGGLGDDEYYVDSMADVVREGAGEGADIVRSSKSYILTAGSHVERLTTTNGYATVALNLTGNEFNQTIIGNYGQNILNGGGGSDVLLGYGGDDQYYVDSMSDSVIEFAGEGQDVVRSSVTYILTPGSHVETLSTTSGYGVTNLDLSGNEFDQTIIGNYGDNILDGARGTDVLIGLGGNDTYIVDRMTDAVIEYAGEGTDTVITYVSYALGAGSHVENLRSASAESLDPINLTGNGFANEISGNAGANRIDGGRGADILLGGLGNDSFAFSTALGGDNVDIISDFAPGSDRILLGGATGQPFSALSKGALSQAAFVVGTTATDADDRIVYNAETGEVFYDADGNGAGPSVLFALVDAGTILSAGDFFVA